MHVAGTCAVLLTSLFTTVVTTTAASPAHATLHPLPIFLAPGAPALYPTVRIAIGVVSAPGRDALRREARQTWLAHRFVPPELAVRFVMQVSAADCARILAEGYEDVLLVDHDAADTSRAAWRKQWVWLEYAVRAFPNATHILHAEDDTYLNLAVISRAIASPLFQSGAGALHVAGQLEAFSWAGTRLPGRLVHHAQCRCGDIPNGVQHAECGAVLRALCICGVFFCHALDAARARAACVGRLARGRRRAVAGVRARRCAALAA